MKDRIISILKLFVSLLIFFSIGFIASVILKLFNIDVNSLSNKGNVLYQFVVSLVMFFILVIFYFKDIRKDYSAFKNNIGNNIKSILKLFCIFMIVKYVVAFVTAMIMTILDIDTNSIVSVNQTTIQSYVNIAPIIMVITTSFLAPIYEETLFRLGFKKVLNKGILFVIVSGFIFGILHVFPLSEGVSLTLGIIQSISYVTMGIFLAYIYNKTDNIFISVGIHFLNNLIGVLTMINMM